MLKESVRKIRVVGLMLTLEFAVLCGTVGQPAPRGPLLFRIVLPRSTVCVGEHHLNVESELRNVSDHPVSLSPAGIKAQVSFTNRACSIGDGFRSNTISTDPAPGWKAGKVVKLGPGQSYRQTLKLELDPEFFQQGIYRVQIGYSGKYGAADQSELFTGALDSNEVLFEVSDCADSSAKRP